MVLFVFPRDLGAAEMHKVSYGVRSCWREGGEGSDYASYSERVCLSYPLPQEAGCDFGKSAGI